MERKEFRVHSQSSGMRIDLFLASQLPDLSRRKVRQILDVGGCYVNGKRMRIASRVVQGGDVVKVEYSLESLKKIRQKDFKFSASDILYDEQNVIALNKPPGLPSQATRDQSILHAEVCLKNHLIASGRKQVSLTLLHRLDKETSGALLFATNNNTATWITDQFRKREVHKTYWALARGISKEKEFEVECYLSDINPKSGLVEPVKSGGKSSFTKFKTIAVAPDLGISLVHCFPETGRSHQIRVHLEMMGLPILGDKRYGRQNQNQVSTVVLEHAAFHHMLHAREISVSPAPNLEPIVVTADPPEHFLAILKQAGLHEREM